MEASTFMKWVSETNEKISSIKNKENEGDKKMNQMEVKIGIVVSEFNYEITYAMLELAKEHAKFLGAEVVKILKVPGVFDIPLALKKILEDSNIDAAVALGAVIEGQTQHDELIAQQASRKIIDLSIEYGKPVGLGISGPGMSHLEAHERVEYAKNAVEAAVKMVKRLREFSEGANSSALHYSPEEESAFAGLRMMG